MPIDYLAFFKLLTLAGRYMRCDKRRRVTERCRGFVDRGRLIAVSRSVVFSVASSLRSPPMRMRNQGPGQVRSL